MVAPPDPRVVQRESGHRRRFRVFLDLREAGEICSKHRIARRMRVNQSARLARVSSTALVPAAAVHCDGSKQGVGHEDNGDDDASRDQPASITRQLRLPGWGDVLRMAAAVAGRGSYLLVVFAVVCHAACGGSTPTGPTTTTNPPTTPPPVPPAPAPQLLSLSGTVFMDTDVIIASDPTAFVDATYTGTGNREMFDRRQNRFVTYKAFLFNATFGDGLRAEIAVNPEFQTSAAAAVVAKKYGRVIGQIPTSLRRDMRTVWIHRGRQPFGGGNNNVLVHTDQADEYESMGVLEEAIVHESSHTSLDARHAAAQGWIQAQQTDADFISVYARDNPSREDVAESFLPWLAVRFRESRISADLAHTVRTRMPNRLQYFDSQGFDASPIR